MAMNRCYGYGCSRKGIFEVEPVKDVHAWMCEGCFTDKYGKDAVIKYLLGTLPLPAPATQVEVIERSESVRTLRSSGHGRAIPRDYRRDVQAKLLVSANR